MKEYVSMRKRSADVILQTHVIYNKASEILHCINKNVMSRRKMGRVSLDMALDPVLCSVKLNSVSIYPSTLCKSFSWMWHFESIQWPNGVTPKYYNRKVRGLEAIHNRNCWRKKKELFSLRRDDLIRRLMIIIFKYMKFYSLKEWINTIWDSRE